MPPERRTATSPPQTSAGVRQSAVPRQETSRAKNDDTPAQERIYITGFEHHPYYSPEKYKQNLAKRGFKPFERADKKYGSTKNDGHKSAAPNADTRFAQRATDYRQIQDNDPYSSLFGERKSVERLRVKEWQSQFERENAHVELPYDRDGFAARVMPNWFARLACRLRENAGFDPVYPVLFCAMCLCIVALYYMGMNRMKGEEEDIRHLR